MPFLLVIIGLVMIVSALQNTHEALAKQLRGDFVPFGMWVLAIGTVGAIGYIPELRRFSHYFMALIIVAMLLSNKGFFAKLSEAFKLGPITPPATAPAGGGAPTTSPATGKAMVDIPPLPGAGNTGIPGVNVPNDVAKSMESGTMGPLMLEKAWDAFRKFLSP